MEIDYDRPAHTQAAAAAEFSAMEADFEAARLLTMQAAWMADNGKPNSLEASMAKAKAGRTGTDITLRCVALCGSVGYGESELLEKWARDAKILDIFEGTQQIQIAGRRPRAARQDLGRAEVAPAVGAWRTAAIAPLAQVCIAAVDRGRRWPPLCTLDRPDPSTDRRPPRKHCRS